MSEPFVRRFVVRWGDVDFNGHMRNTAYLDASSDVRMLCFAAAGFPMSEFARLRFGPVVRRDELEYFRELRLLDEYAVSLAVAGLSEDGSRFRLRNEFEAADGARAARVTSGGGWLDLERRRLAPPPPELAGILLSLPRTDDFEMLSAGGR